MSGRKTPVSACRALLELLDKAPEVKTPWSATYGKRA